MKISYPVSYMGASLVVDYAMFIVPLKMYTAHWMIVKCYSTLLQLSRISYGSAGKLTARLSGRRLNDLRRMLLH